jgi:hypothetical protein
MEIKFIVTKEERKEFVKTIGAFVGWAPVYKGAPSFAYAVNNYIIDRNGTLTYDERTDEADAQRLLSHLASEGFVRDWYGDASEQDSNPAPAQSQSAEAPAVSVVVDSAVVETVQEETQPGEASEDTEQSEADIVETTSDAPSLKTIIVDMPLFNDTALDNLRKMIDGKASLIKKAIGADDLTVVVIGGALHFNWFNPDSTDAELEAYKQFVSALCVIAKNQKRVTMKESAVDSEKFAFRCFLLKLGFIGGEYAAARKILLEKLSGNSSFKSGDHKSRSVHKGSETADSGEDNAEGTDTPDGDNEANTPDITADTALPERCGECRHHCYYTDGDMVTNTGETVDTSNRKPEQYTHYCLAAPSGFRRIKHAVDWSGAEAPASWCPIKINNEEGIDNE